MSDPHETESLGKSQALRRSIRTLLATHAQANQDSFKSHMATSAVFWLLAGRQGLSLEDRESLVTQAHTYIDRLREAYPEDPLLEEAHAEVVELEAMNTGAKAHATENVPQPGDIPVDEFMKMMQEAWKAEDPAPES